MLTLWQNTNRCYIENQYALFSDIVSSLEVELLHHQICSRWFYLCVPSRCIFSSYDEPLRVRHVPINRAFFRVPFSGESPRGDITCRYRRHYTYIHISPFAFIYSLCMHTCEAFGQYGRQTLEPETCLCPRDRLYRRRTLAEYVVCYVSINSNKIIILTLGIRSMQTI